MNYFDRFIQLISNEKYNKIQKLNILIIGCGGVGGYAVEGLARCGIENISLVDFDQIDPTNINRQIIANTSNIGQKKVVAWENRLKLINPNLKIKTYDLFLDKSNIDLIKFVEYDFVIDACDTMSTKKLIIEKCLTNNISFITSMGMGNRLDASSIKIMDLRETKYDKIAKIMRKWVKDNNIKNKIPVVCSNTECLNTGQNIGSVIYAPAIAGMLITNYVITKTLEKE